MLRKDNDPVDIVALAAQSVVAQVRPLCRRIAELQHELNMRRAFDEQSLPGFLRALIVITNENAVTLVRAGLNADEIEELLSKVTDTNATAVATAVATYRAVCCSRIGVGPD